MSIQQLWDSPPYPFIEQIGKNCADALTTYLFLWSKKGKNNCAQITKEDISYRMHPNKFKSDLRKLYNEALINFAEGGGLVSVEMIVWEDFDEMAME
jgi:hypothetical protein